MERVPFTAKVTSKGQITIPKEVRDKLRLAKGTTIRFECQENGTVVLRPKTGDILKFRDSMKKYLSRPLTQKEIDDAIGRSVLEDDMRIRRQRQ